MRKDRKPGAENEGPPEKMMRSSRKKWDGPARHNSRTGPKQGRASNGKTGLFVLLLLRVANKRYNRSKIG